MPDCCSTHFGWLKHKSVRTPTRERDLHLNLAQVPKSSEERSTNQVHRTTIIWWCVWGGRGDHTCPQRKAANKPSTRLEQPGLQVNIRKGSTTKLTTPAPPQHLGQKTDHLLHYTMRMLSPKWPGPNSTAFLNSWMVK